MHVGSYWYLFLASAAVTLRWSEVSGWRELADELRERIRRGVYPPDTPLPSEVHLVQEFGLSRTTVRRAIAQLKAEGLILVQHGRATRVRAEQKRERLILRSGTDVDVRMPTPEERKELKLADGVPVIVVTGPDGWTELYAGDRYTLRVP